MENNGNHHLLLDLYQMMRRIRIFEEQVIHYYPEQEMRSPVHLCIGQEAIAAGVCKTLNVTDTMFSTHRNHGHCIAKGMPYYQLLAEFYGKKTGCAGGKGGSMHPVAVELGILGTTAIVGGNIPIAVGSGWSHQFKKNGNIAVAFFGDGASEEGTFHESLNFAALKKIPVLFVCENNLYATASKISSRQAKGTSIAEKAACYGMVAIEVDGNDVEAVYAEAGKAAERARNGGGPTFIEAKTYRWKAHVGPVDDTETGHRPKDELDGWIKKCPLARIEHRLWNTEFWNSEEDKVFQQKLVDEFKEAMERAKEDPFPSLDDCFRNVFQE